MKFDPLPVLSHKADEALKDFSVWNLYPAPEALEELFAQGLLCDNDGDGLPCELCITNAGQAYLEGRRLPSIVIPDYYTGEIDDSDDECPDPNDDPRHDFPPMNHPYWDIPDNV
jgi:hypothetical protein